MSQVKRSSILKELLAIARKGFPIFPCKPDKKPYISGGFKSASTDPKQIKAWFQEFPDALWGMPTGKISGIMVLDVDMPEGENSLAALEAENSPLPATKEVLTQSGGRHIYFKYVAGAKCSAGQLAKNLDIRTDGGYVIIPPSAGYTVVKDVAIADAPTWLVWLIQKLKSKKSSRKSSADAHVANSILDGMCKEMAQTQEGERNDKLNALAFQLGLMVGNKELPESALDKLMEAALESGLELDEIESTSQSGFTAGVQKAATEDRIPAGFTLDENWLFYTSDKQTMRVSTPLKILARTRDESGNSWGILIEWKDLDGNLHRLVMSHAMLIDRLVWLTPLVDGGLILATHQRAVGLLHTYLTSYRTHNRAICIDRTGWHRGAFVFPDTVMYVGEVESVGNPVNTAILSLQQADPSVGKSDEQIVLQIQTPTNPYKLGGTFEGWQNGIAKLAEGNSRLILVLCAAFAAPLLQLVGHENFGINIAGKSSSGKSTAIVAAVSVWGKGSTDYEGYARSWNSTSNGLEGVATMHNDTLLALDEMGQASARTVSEAAYMLGNGIGKSRARTDGSAKIARRWRTVLLSSGEKGVAEKISDDGGQVQAGQLVRIIEILADADSGLGLFEDLHGRKSAQAFADEIKQAAATHHGHAARAFIKAIQADTERVIRILTEALPSKLKDLLPTDSADGEVRRVASHFSLLAIASELAIDFGIVNWSKDTPFKAIKACFDAWLLQRGGIGSAEDTAMLEKAKRLLITHGESRFQDINADVIGTIHNRLGFKRDVFDDQTGITITEYYMPPEIFKKEISSNKNVPPLLCKHGLLRQGDGAGRRGYTRKPSVQLPGLGYKRCYVLVLPDEYHHSESDDPAEAKQILDEAIMFNKAMQEDDVIIELDEVLS